MTAITDPATEWELAPPMSTRLRGAFGATYRAAKRDKVLAVSITILLLGLFLAFLHQCWQGPITSGPTR